MDQQTYKDIISGRKEGPFADFLRLLLNALSYPYLWAIQLRNYMYDKHLRKINYVRKPVISIGNLTTGGTGKTPLVVWLCNFLTEKGKKCAILTRGYKAQPGKLSDEPAILTKNCPGTKVIVQPDRYQGALKAENKHNSDVFIMDDGFQHRRLNRDLDILAVDATNPFGYGKILPAGLLREPLKSLKRAKAVILTKTDLIDDTKLALLEKKIADINPELIIAHSIHQPVGAVKVGQKRISLEELKNRNIFAFCGIGNPDAFLNTLEKLNINVAGHKVYNDHHDFTREDFIDIYEEAKYVNADLILSTQKDWTKTILFAGVNQDLEFAYLRIAIKFTRNEEPIRKLIEHTIADKIT